MSFNWKTYISLAEELLNNNTNSVIIEAYYRSSMSRSYYGVYGIACIYLLEKDILKAIPKWGSHQAVHNKFGSFRDEKIMLKISENLKNLWKERKDADYQTDSEITRSRAETANLLAKETIEIFATMGGIQVEN